MIINSITARLTASLGLVLCLGLGGTIYAAYGYGRTAANEAFDSLLRGAALQISERVFVVDGKINVDIPVSAFELLSLAKNERVFYRITGPDGELLTGYPDFPMANTGQRGDRRSTNDQPIIYQTTYAGTEVRALEMRKSISERAVTGDIQIVVAHTLENRNILARTVATQAVTAIATAGLGILALTFLALKFATRPLQRVEQALLARDPLDLSPLSVQAPAEIAALMTAINRFMGRLDRRVQSMQDFVADTAHQIRTPIAALRVQSELALDETDIAKLKRLHRRIHARTIGLNRLTEQLLSRALITHRSDAEPHELADLRRVVLQAEREFRLTAGAGQDVVSLDLSDDEIMVTCDSFSLREAIKNLLNNALIHGKPPITLSCFQHDGRAIALVSDKGPGFAAEASGEIGKRFANRPTDTKNAGIGLSIVREVVTIHHGEIIVERSPGGFAIGLSLPLVSGTIDTPSLEAIS